MSKAEFQIRYEFWRRSTDASKQEAEALAGSKRPTYFEMYYVTGYHVRAVVYKVLKSLGLVSK